MDRFRAWLHAKPWHEYILVALTIGLFVLAYKTYKSRQSGGTAVAASPFVGQTSAGMVDNAQYDELRNELAALQSYVNNPNTPNAPTSQIPTGPDWNPGGPHDPHDPSPVLPSRPRDPLNGQGGWFTLPSAMSVEGLARFFNLKQGSSGAPNEEWTRIAYNPNNAGILPDSYAQHGNNVLPAGSSVYIDPAAYAK